MKVTIENNIASRINQEHRQVAEGLRSALEAARRCGALLLQAKHGVKHGEWLSWLQANFEGSERTARAYMRIADRWTELEAKRQTTADLTIDSALKLLAEPRQEAEQEQGKDRLTEQEREQLAAIESRLELHREEIRRCGREIFAIRERRLFREYHRTFEAFCEDEFEIPPEVVSRLARRRDEEGFAQVYFDYIWKEGPSITKGTAS